MGNERVARVNPLGHIGAAGLLFCTVSAVFPPLRTVGNNAVYCVIALGIWLLASIARRPSFFFRPTVYRLLAGLLVLAAPLVAYLFGNVTVGNRYMSLSIVSLGFVIYDYYERAVGGTRVLQRLLAITGVFAAYTGVRTVMGLVEAPFLARSIKSSGEYSAGLSAIGIGGYEYVYLAVIIGPMALYLASVPTRARTRLAAAAVYVLSFVVVVLSNYLTAFVVLVVASVATVLFRLLAQGRNPFRAALLSVLVALALLYGPALTGAAIRLVAGASPGGRIAGTLQTADGSLLDGLREEYAFDRWPSMVLSLEATVSHPVTGIVVRPIAVSGGYLTGFGQHSHILDTFALFGVALGLLNVVVLFDPIRRRLRDPRLLALAVPVGLSYAVILILNNATPSLAVAASLAFPLLYREEQLRLDGAVCPVPRSASSPATRSVSVSPAGGSR